MIVGDRLLIPSGNLAQPSRVVAIDLESMSKDWVVEWTNQPRHYLYFVPTRDHLFVIETRTQPGDNMNERGFRIHQHRMRDGSRVRTIENDLAWNDPGGFVAAGSFRLDSKQHTFSPVQPLLYKGKLFIVTTGTAGSKFWVWEVGDQSSNVLQYRFNNQRNPVVCLFVRIYRFFTRRRHGWRAVMPH